MKLWNVQVEFYVPTVLTKYVTYQLVVAGGEMHTVAYRAVRAARRQAKLDHYAPADSFRIDSALRITPGEAAELLKTDMAYLRRFTAEVWKRGEL